jgi:glycerol-3-phosphate acyltransferase PlsY
MSRFFNSVILGAVLLALLTGGLVATFLTMGNEPEPARYAVVLALAYLLGSIPWGYVLLRWRLGLDIREFGSGGIGGANVLRTAGGKVAGVVLALDLGKGILAVVLAREVVGEAPAEVAAGLLVLAGHNWPIFLQFRGGRGVATGLGGLSVMAPMAAGIGAFCFILIALLSRYISLASMSGAVIACLSVLALALAGIYSSVYTIYAVLGAVMIFWQHRENIRRLLHGNERRLGQSGERLH